jgi:hypothetical protein
MEELPSMRSPFHIIMHIFKKNKFQIENITKSRKYELISMNDKYESK